MPDGGGAHAVPRLGLILHATDHAGLKLLRGEAFRSPWPVEQIIDHPVLEGNPDLEPETIHTGDLQLFWNDSNKMCTLTYFNSHYGDLITRVPHATDVGRQTFENRGGIRVHGDEMEGSAMVGAGVRVFGSAMYQKVGDDLMPTSSFMAKLGITFKPVHNVSLGFFNSYFSKPVENDGAEVNPASEALNLLSCNLRYRIPMSTRVTLTAYGRNLLGRRYNFPEF